MYQTDVLMATKPVVDVFEVLNIPYYIGGSVASSAYGTARATMDVDIVANIKPHHVPSFSKQLEQLYYIDKDMILEAINKQSSFNLLHLETMLKVDVFVLKNEPYHQVALQRRRKDTLDDEQNTTEFYFVSVEDIVLSKLDWYRQGNEISERQWNDVLGVLKVQCRSLDLPYLEEWAITLQVDDLLQRAFDEAGIIRT